MSVSQMKVYDIFRPINGSKKSDYTYVNVGDKDAADAAERMLQAYLATHPI